MLALDPVKTNQKGLTTHVFFVKADTPGIFGSHGCYGESKLVARG
jgi:hypothetical protein